MNNIITISGDPGSGKSTTIKYLQQCFENQGKKVIVYSIGDVFRELAEKKGMTVEEFNKFLQKNNKDVDANIDIATKNLGKKILQEQDENKIYIIDSRLAWFKIPESFKVRLTITDTIAGQRIFNDKTRGKEDKYPTLEDAVRATKERKRSEQERYKKLYGQDCDLADENNFDININTAFVEPEEIAKLIVDSLARKNRGEFVCNTWASPKIFLPTQPINDTKYTVDEVASSIKKNGYDPIFFINAIEKRGMYLILDGHHRAMGAAKEGVNLIPFYCETTKEESIPNLPYYQIEVLKDFFGDRYKTVLYDYEEVWRDEKTGRLTYKYEDLYPGIYGLTQTTGNKDEQIK